MDEWDRICSLKPTDNPSEEARQLAMKLYADELALAAKKDAEEGGTFFCDILMKNKEFKINLLAKCYETDLRNKRTNQSDDSQSDDLLNQIQDILC